MQEWWESMDLVLRILYCIAIPSTLILVLQMILSAAGGGSDGGADVSDTSGLDLDLDVDTGGGLDLGDTGGLDLGADGVHDGGDLSDFGTLKLLSLQTIVTFLTVFSWVSIVCLSSRMSGTPAMLIGAAAGLVMMFVVAKMVQMSVKLAENGTLNLRYAIGETGTVYLTVPPAGEGEGKVNLKVQGRFGEFSAVSTGREPLPTGSQVLVTDVVGGVLVVEKLSADA